MYIQDHFCKVILSDGVLGCFADCPEWLIRDDDFRSLFRRKRGDGLSDLFSHIGKVSSFIIALALAHAEDRHESVRECVSELLGDDSI